MKFDILVKAWRDKTPVVVKAKKGKVWKTTVNCVQEDSAGFRFALATSPTTEDWVHSKDIESVEIQDTILETLITAGRTGRTVTVHSNQRVLEGTVGSVVFAEGNWTLGLKTAEFGTCNISEKSIYSAVMTVNPPVDALKAKLEDLETKIAQISEEIEAVG